MRILFVTQSFPPEMGALPSRMYPFVQELTNASHEVFVATGMPNYPKGVVFEDYRGKWSAREKVDGATVLRTAYYCVPRNISRLRQLLSYLSFLPSVFWSGLRAGKVDVVFVTSPPLFPAIAAITLARLRSARLVFDIRDLWPDEIVACGGAAAGSLPVRMMSVLESWVYRCADCVCCTTPAFMSTVRERRSDSSNIVYLPNGADLELFRPAFPGQSDARPENLCGRFLVLFSGILGMKQGLDTLLAAAKLLEHERDIVFYLIGTGSCERHIAESIATLGLTNLILAGEKSLKEVATAIRSADICVSLLKPDPYLEKIVSVKIYEYLACGKPVVGAHDGESARVIRDSGAGLVVPPGDPEAIAEAICRLRNDPDLRRELGGRGHRWIEQHHSRRRIAQRLDGILTSLVASGKANEDRGRVSEAAPSDQGITPDEKIAAD